MSNNPAGIVAGLNALPLRDQACVVSIGVFDGVHVGHQALLTKAVKVARSLNVPAVTLTFDPDPEDVLNPSAFPNALMPVEKRCRLIRDLGMDWVVVIRFTEKLAALSAEDFIQRVLVRRLHVKRIVVGSNFRFGAKARGNIRLLKKVGDENGFQVLAVNPIQREGASVSSSRIRRLIHSGHIGEAKRLVGRAPELFGRVVKGEGRGRQMGVPTANIALNPQTVPPQGVYVVKVEAEGRMWEGVMNYGTRPTFCPDGSVVCEVHLLGYSGNLYGQTLAVSLLRRLRSEKTFSNQEALTRQIHSDIDRAKEYFKRDSSF